MRGVSESSPTRAMAEDLDVEAMLEAPYKKGVSLTSLSVLYSSLFAYLFSLPLSLSFGSLSGSLPISVLARTRALDGWRDVFPFILFFFLMYALAAVREKGNSPLSSIPLSHFHFIFYSLFFCLSLSLSFFLCIL